LKVVSLTFISSLILASDFKIYGMRAKSSRIGLQTLLRIQPARMGLVGNLETLAKSFPKVSSLKRY